MSSLVALAPGFDSTAYARGVADGRRTAEGELAAERAAIATLAMSLADALDALDLLTPVEPPADVRARWPIRGDA